VRAVRAMSASRSDAFVWSDDRCCMQGCERISKMECETFHSPHVSARPTALKLTPLTHTYAPHHTGSTPLADAGIRIAMPIARHTARAQVHACPCTLNAH
jgi:hypothetical protein